VSVTVGHFQVTSKSLVSMSQLASCKSLLGHFEVTCNSSPCGCSPGGAARVPGAPRGPGVHGGEGGAAVGGAAGGGAHAAGV